MEIQLPPLHKGQQTIHNSKARFRVVAAGRRFGKTRLAVLECVEAGVMGKRVWWLVPVYYQAEAAWRDLIALAGKIPGAKIERSDNTIRFGNGGFITVRTTTEPDNLRSEGLDFVVFDEAAFMESVVWSEAIRPALADRRGRALFISSPNGRNWYYELYQAARRDTTGTWETFQMPMTANPLIKAEEIEQIRASTTPENFAQEYMGEFVKHSGMVYPEFTHAVHVTDQMPQRFVTVLAGVDIGYKNPTAMILGGLDADDTLWIFREEYRPQVVYDEWVKVAHDLQNLYRIEQWFVDPAAAEFVTAMTNASLHATGANNDVLPGINAVKTRLLMQGTTTPSLFIHPNCINLIDEMEVYQWQKNRDGLVDKVKKSHDHAVDALRYLVMGVQEWVGSLALEVGEVHIEPEVRWNAY